MSSLSLADASDAELPQLRWRPEIIKCSCGADLIRSCFRNAIIQTEYEVVIEKCELCGHEDSRATEELPKPSPSLCLGGKSLIVNNRLSIGKRGTSGDHTNMRTRKEKRIQKTTENGGSVVERLHAAAETSGTPYFRIQVSEECTELWQVAAKSINYGDFSIGDLTVSASEFDRALAALKKTHPVYRALIAAGLRSSDLENMEQPMAFTTRKRPRGRASNKP